MSTRTRLLSPFAAFLAAFVMLLASTSNALALDRIILKDGNRVIEGTIYQEINGVIFIKYMEGGVEKRASFHPEDLIKVERDVKPEAPKADPAPAAVTPAAPAATAPKAPVATPTATTDAKEATPAVAPAAGLAVAAPVGNKVPKAAIITLGDRINGEMVGLYFKAYALKEAIPALEKELGTDKSGVVVFRIYSGGGALSEIEKLWGVIRGDYMKRWRCVAWIESAISAAAMTAHCMDEVYMTSQANYGACTGWSGNLVAMKGPGLERVLMMMEEVSRRSGYDPLLMRAMQVYQPLSAEIQPDGTVKFYGDDTSGSILVNRVGEILTLNAVTAREIKFSKGTADTTEELARLMGYQELEWIGEKVPGIAWKVCKAEKMQMDFRKRTKVDEDRFEEYIQRYNTALAVAQRLQNRDDRAIAIGKARQALNDIKGAMKHNPYFMAAILNTDDEKAYKEWVEEQEKLLRDLMK